MSDLIPVAQYIRYSSEMQRDGHTVASQRDHNERYAASSNMQVVETFIDEAISGGTHERAEFQRMLLMARSQRRHWRGVLVYDVTRFSRSAGDIALFDELDRLGVPVISTTQRFDQSADGRLMRNINIVMGAHMREKLSEDAQRRKKARALGRRKSNATRPPFGYRRDAGEDVPDEPRFTVWREMIDLMLTGLYSAGDIAAELRARGILTRDGRPFSKDTVLSMLRNPFYAGKVVYVGMAGKHPDGRPKRRSKKERVIEDGTHRPLITWEEYQQLMAMMRTHTRSSGGHPTVARDYLLQDVAVCAGCGRRLTCCMTGGSGNDAPYYQCRSHERGIACSCTRHMVAEVALVPAVDEFISRIRLTDDVIDAAVTLSQSPTIQNERERRAEGLRAEQRRLNIMFQAGGIEDNEYTRELARIKVELAELQPPTPSDVEQAAEVMTDQITQWANMTTAERNEALRVMLASVVIDLDQRAIVEWRVRPAYAELLQSLDDNR